MHPFTVIVGQPPEHPFASSGALHKFVREQPSREVPITLIAVCQVRDGGTREPPRLAGQRTPCPGCQGTGGGRHTFASTDELKAFVEQRVPTS